MKYWIKAKTYLWGQSPWPANTKFESVHLWPKWMQNLKKFPQGFFILFLNITLSTICQTVGRGHRGIINRKMSCAITSRKGSKGQNWTRLQTINQNMNEFRNPLLMLMLRQYLSPHRLPLIPVRPVPVICSLFLHRHHLSLQGLTGRQTHRMTI